MGWLFVTMAIVGITLGIVYGLRRKSETIKFGAVVSNGQICSEIGGQILQQGGSAVDAAIATLLSEGVILPHSMGLGGGFIATIFDKETGKVETLVARETAPLAAHQNMFVDREITGAIAAAIPSEIYGYWRLHTKYGKLPWKSLFKPTIELCRNGHRVSKYLANVLENNAERIQAETSMAEVFVNPATGVIYKEGDIMYRPRLAETLTIIAEEGYEAIYRGGRVGKMLVEDIQEMGGIITEEDLQSYEVRWEEPVVSHFTSDYCLYTTPLPTSGSVLAFMLNVMGSMYTEREDVYWQRMIETFKHAYGYRTKLGDVHYEPHVAEIGARMTDSRLAAEIRQLIQDDRTNEDMSYYGANFVTVDDHGTANMAVLAPNGDGVAITSTINNHFGAKVRSRRTGIILNDQMDDFCTPGVINAYGIPASPANYIKPGKRPMSSTCPSIVLDKQGKMRLLIGGAGGSRITTSVAQTILRYFVLGQSMEESVNAGRVHHQLAPMYVDVEPEVPIHLSDTFMRIGHSLNYLPESKAYSALTAIGLKTDVPFPVSDRRRMGGAIVIRTRS